MNYLLTLIFTFLLISPGNLPDEPEHYLFSYFQKNGQDGLHLAYSEDGLHWKALNNNQSVLTPQVGQDRLMRDPCIIRGGDGQFHMVWTVSWKERGIGYASSPDLIHWAEQQYLPVMEHEPTAMNCWAPELYYDEASQRYLIYWATTIPGRFPATEASADKGRNHWAAFRRLYYTTTTDFVTFSDTELLYDDGFNVIDGTIQKVDSTYVMFLKDETKHPVAEKNIRIATASSLLGPYSAASAPITNPDNWVEGPTVTHTDQGWVVYFDQYTQQKMGAVQSTDLVHWTDISDQLTFPEGTRHGTVLKVKASVLNQLRQAYSE